MVLTKCKTEIKSKIKKIMEKKDAFFMTPANFRDLKKEIDQLVSYAEAEYEARYVEVRKKYSKALPPELRSQSSIRKALEKQRRGNRG